LAVTRFSISERRACGLLGVWRSSCRYKAKPDLDSQLREQLTELARERPRFGYRGLAVLLARSGHTVNHKKLFRVYREAGLSVKRIRRKKWVRVGVSQPRLAAPNEEWSLDFLCDVVAGGRTICVLSVVDNFTRECLALKTDTSFGTQRVTRVLEHVIARHATPKALRMDNGPQLTSRHFLAWCVERKITRNHIQPGTPVQNGQVESFHGRLRDECLNVNWFRNLFEARRKITLWQQDYNAARPHSSLGYRTPDEFAAQWQRPSSSPNWISQPEPSVKAILAAHYRAALTDEPGRKTTPDMRTKGSQDEVITW
jgi:putative transposase